MARRMRSWLPVGVLLLLLARAPAGEFPAELVRWKPFPGNPVFAGAGDGAWDRKIRERGFILRGRDGYRLWYTGYNDARSPLRLLGLATSADGIHWARAAANPLVTDSWVEDVCVVRVETGFVMFAEGKEDIAHQLTSSDGIHWTEQGALDVRRVDGRPIAPGPYGTPTAWFEDGRWYLFYERGDRGVWLATSTDRKTFTNVSDDPVIPCGPAAYDREAVALNQVIKREGVYYGFYHANSARPWKDWTTCIARSRDLVHWEKFAGNPIIRDNCSSPVLVTTPMGDRLYTMHPDVRIFLPAADTR